MPESVPPIIIIKKKRGHAGHHGGAWKVAYADFVTAMMALFIVLWLMNSNQKIKEAVAGYFKDPKGYGQQSGSGQAGSGEGVAVGRDDMHQLQQKLANAIQGIPELQGVRDNVKITVTGEGLRVELLEAAQEMFFTTGSARPTTGGEELLGLLARELGRLPNELAIEGHTDSRPYASPSGYSNWELSADRANAARRLMEASGLRSRQVSQVRGFADRSLRDQSKPEDPSNRRVTVIVRYQRREEPGAAATTAPPPAAAKHP